MTFSCFAFAFHNKQWSNRYKKDIKTNIIKEKKTIFGKQ